MTRSGPRRLLAAGVLVGGMALPAAAQQTYFTRMLGPEGAGGAQSLSEVSDLVVDSRDRLFVAGRGSNNVLCLTPTGQISVLIDGGHDPTGDGFAGPIALAVDGEDRLLVACETSATVHRIEHDGTVTQLAGSGAGLPLERPGGLGVAPDGRIFVTDRATDTIHELVPGGSPIAHTYIGGGDGLDHMEEPGRLSVDASGHVAVICEGTRSVFHLGQDGKLTRRFVGTWPWTGFQFLEDVAFLPGGALAVSSAGHLLELGVAGAVSPLLAPPEFAGPWHRLAVSAGGALLVTSSTSLLRIEPGGAVRDLLDDPANPFQVWVPGAVATDSRGNAFVASRFSDEVFQVGLPWPVSFQASCHGDGTAGICACGNHAAPGEGCANSTGRGASLSAWGSDGIAADDLQFLVEGAPAGAEALLFVGDARSTTPFVQGDGLRCASGSLRRLEVRRLGADGSVWFGPALGAAGAFVPGETRWFQVLYRDTIAGPCSTGRNLSNAVSATFVP